MTDEIEITSREAVERLAFMLERDAEDQNFQPCEMTGLLPDDEHTIAATLRALLARAEAAQADLINERARLHALESEVAALREIHQSDIATGAELEAKLAAAREWADDLLDAAEQAYKDGGAEMHRLIRTPPDFYDADAPARADLADAAYLEGVKAGLEAAARTARGDGESEFFNPVQAIRALDPAAVARAAQKEGE